MAAPRELPLEARRAAWDALWKILLAPPTENSAPPESAKVSGVLSHGQCGQLNERTDP
jgi:hypothetical protein